jgi:hypothetical protein
VPRAESTLRPSGAPEPAIQRCPTVHLEASLSAASALPPAWSGAEPSRGSDVTVEQLLCHSRAQHCGLRDAVAAIRIPLAIG